MIKKYAPLIYIYLIISSLSIIGFFIVKKLYGIPDIWNIICGIGLIIATLFVFFYGLYINKKNNDLKEIKDIAREGRSDSYHRPR